MHYQTEVSECGMIPVYPYITSDEFPYNFMSNFFSI